MSKSVFLEAYASAYDALYQDKDYELECDLLEKLFRAHEDKAGTKRVLDLGCGTGNHALPLAKRGYEVVGIDLSPAMLAAAKAKSPTNSSARFELGDVSDLQLDEQFDVAIMMFAVLGYQHSNADVHAALSSARRHLRPGGLLIFDVWYGPAVLTQRPGSRTKEVPLPDGGRLVRKSDSQLDSRTHRCQVLFNVKRYGKAGALQHETDETHDMRFFFPLELELLLAPANLTPVRMCGFPDLDREPNEEAWDLLVVARAE